MATKDTPTGGLLARVASFVRSPAPDAPAQASAVPSDPGELGKLAIKRMVERKAHNDAVRQREFSQLRKLREASPAALSEMAARASFYQDSSGFPESETRASTLKKIDEIEAQMSKQWWNGQQRKPGEATAPVPPAQTAARTPVSRAPALAASLTRPSLGVAESQIDTRNAFAPTMPTHLDEPVRSAPGKPQQDGTWSDKPRPHVSLPVGFATFEATNYSDFSNSNMVSIEMGQVLSDPVLEDAAIRFANSDDAGAESVLTLALRGDAVSREAKDIWTIALLDMYRSTGQVAQYERLALDHAQQSHRLACSLGSVLGAATDWQGEAVPLEGAGVVRWQSPVVLDSLAVEHLQAGVATGPTPNLLDWQMLKTLPAEAAVALVTVMRQWCEQSLILQFDHLDRLDTLLRANTPLGDRTVAQCWWQLRLNVLRVLGSREEFELVSMDYCVTYDVSPPAWQSARCQCVFGQYPDAARIGVGSGEYGNHEATVTDPLTERTPFVDANANRIDLVGEVLGTVATGLKPLQQALLAKGDLLINGEGLVRVDFSAAGSILNWVASAQAAGKKIEFTRLPHLVAAFFNLIGINEHARVTARTN